MAGRRSKKKSDLPKEIAKFSPEDLEEWSKKEAKDKSETYRFLLRLRVEDTEWRVWFRKRLGWILIGLLIIQNVVVFSIIIFALIFGKVADLEIVFGCLIAATLGETAYVVKIIVEWLFRDINYEIK